jgi:hypothetical protein
VGRYGPFIAGTLVWYPVQRSQLLLPKVRGLPRTRTTYQTLNGYLKRLLGSQEELLRVLEDPHLPLHHNLSESDIREYVKRRKISGSTRSDEGRRCRDTFTIV